MSLYKIAVGLIAVMVGAAAVTALAGTNPDAKPELAATPAAQVDVAPPVSACPDAPGPMDASGTNPCAVFSAARGLSRTSRSRTRRAVYSNCAYNVTRILRRFVVKRVADISCMVRTAALDSNPSGENSGRQAPVT